MESDSASVESRGLFSVGGTLAVVGTEGLAPAPAPAWLLVPLVVGVEDTEVTTGPLVEACGWSCLGVTTARGGSSIISLLPEATDTMGMNSGAAGSRAWGWLVEGCWGALEAAPPPGLMLTVGWTVATSTWPGPVLAWLGSTTAWVVARWAIGRMEAVWVWRCGGM